VVCWTGEFIVQYLLSPWLTNCSLVAPISVLNNAMLELVTILIEIERRWLKEEANKEMHGCKVKQKMLGGSTNQVSRVRN